MADIGRPMGAVQIVRFAKARLGCYRVGGTAGYPGFAALRLGWFEFRWRQSPWSWAP